MSLLRLWPAALAFTLSSCSSDSDIGAPCNTADDCAGDLICDVHEGNGSCQEPHGHDAGEEGSSGSSSSAGTTSTSTTAGSTSAGSTSAGSTSAGSGDSGGSSGGSSGSTGG